MSHADKSQEGKGGKPQVGKKVDKLISPAERIGDLHSGKEGKIGDQENGEEPHNAYERPPPWKPLMP